MSKQRLRRRGLAITLGLTTLVAISAVYFITAVSNEEGAISFGYADAERYNSSRDDLLAERCGRLPGSQRIVTATSFPPTVSIDFSGSADQRRKIEECIARLPNVRYLGYRSRAE